MIPQNQLRAIARTNSHILYQSHPYKGYTTPVTPAAFAGSTNRTFSMPRLMRLNRSLQMKCSSHSIARTRSAFTLLELMVVIVLIVVAAAFVLPTIFKNNEVKYRIQCAANLKQIGLAI